MTRQPMNEVSYDEFGADASLEAIEAKLKTREGSALADDTGGWFRRLYKR